MSEKCRSIIYYVGDIRKHFDILYILFCMVIIGRQTLLPIRYLPDMVIMVQVGTGCCF